MKFRAAPGNKMLACTPLTSNNHVSKMSACRRSTNNGHIYKLSAWTLSTNNDHINKMSASTLSTCIDHISEMSAWTLPTNNGHICSLVCFSGVGQKTTGWNLLFLQYWLLFLQFLHDMGRTCLNLILHSGRHHSSRLFGDCAERS